MECSRRFAQRLAEEMSVPVYLYEASQDKQYRKTLPQIRKGEYEGLRDKVGLVDGLLVKENNLSTVKPVYSGHPLGPKLI